MRYSDEKNVRRLILETILKRSKEVYRHDVKLSFGLDSIGYDEKNDMFSYMPMDRSYFIGKYKEIYFEHVNDVIYCFKPFSTDESLINAFAARVCDYKIEGDIDLLFYPNVSRRGEHFEELIEKIDEMKEKEIKRQEEENRSRN